VNELVIAFLANEVRLMSERLLEALYLPTEQRVLRRLSDVARLYEPDADGHVQVPLTQEQVAGLAGTSRATVNDVLGEAQARGLVQLRRGTIRILDPAALVERARRP
jgi:CRP-like cAMP-binding protein